ncbi:MULTISPECIES: glycosyl transferase family protein [unclassified Acinetobacter]|uniref:glycosyl transferase family protein n=1 Tax=unclassified Acinetobacter TaxID=196816 RepID=UPI0035B9786C
MTATNPTQILATTEHNFAQYIRILGKGKTGHRSLSFDEAYQAFSMILKGEVLDLQIGAFLMLLRVKEESVEELAAFVQASRDNMQLPKLLQAVDLDWSSYAGKRKHYPWFVLSALTLAQHGYRVVMHGTEGHSENRLYTAQALRALNIQICQDLNDVEAHLNQQHFAYIALPLLSPSLAKMIDYRQYFGLRSPINSLTRLLNPFDAKATMQAIFHPAYRNSHQQAAKLLGYQNSVVMKGEGGEFERNPDAKTLLCGIRHGELYELELPKLNAHRSEIENEFDLNFFLQVWQGTVNHDYGLQAIIETMAIALMTMNVCMDYRQAQQKALTLWQTRFEK